MAKHKNNELIISFFGTTICAAFLLLLFAGQVSFLKIIVLNCISLLAYGVSVLSQKIDHKYGIYVHRKKMEVIENTFDDVYLRKVKKVEGTTPKNGEYYKLVAPVKVLYTVFAIVSIPFILWHETTQLFGPYYKKVFKIDME